MGLYESTIMTFGLCNAPATFQTFMDIEFGPLIKEGHVVVYLDNILIYAATIMELLYWTQSISTTHKTGPLPSDVHGLAQSP